MANKDKDVEAPVEEPSLEQQPQIFNSNPLATCSCTKISTMQLFHEMKQQFPTVPDNVVCEYVEQNCHNPLACINSLKKYPNSANVYPQALRNQPKKRNPNRNSTIQKRSEQMGSIVNKDRKHFKQTANNNQSSNETNVPQPQNTRPKTLNLPNLNSTKVNRPTRTAPPPPVTTPQKSNTNQQPLNLSLNVIVSPVTPNSQQARSSRPNQSTSVSFTLHQPNNSKTVTIPVNTNPEQSNADSNENGPSLKYTSSAYDSEYGCQSRLEITVAGTSPMNGTSPLENGQPNRNNGIIAPVIDNNSMQSSTHAVLPCVTASPQFIEETDTVHHQQLSKQRLIMELEKERNGLERMQIEIQAIQLPIPEGGIEILSKEIETLRQDCDQMSREVEEAGPSYALGETNEAFYKNVYTGQYRQALRPHRPAPIPDIHLNQKPISLPNLQLSSAVPSYQNVNEASTSEESSGWNCNTCTFRNKLTQRNCELCAMPFLSAGIGMNPIYNYSILPNATPKCPLTQYAQMPMPSYSPQNYYPQMPYVVYQPSNSSQTTVIQHPQYINGYQTHTMATYPNP